MRFVSPEKEWSAKRPTTLQMFAVRSSILASVSNDSCPSENSETVLCLCQTQTNIQGNSRWPWTRSKDAAEILWSLATAHRWVTCLYRTTRCHDGRHILLAHWWDSCVPCSEPEFLLALYYDGKDRRVRTVPWCDGSSRKSVLVFHHRRKAWSAPVPWKSLQRDPRAVLPFPHATARDDASHEASETSCESGTRQNCCDAFTNNREPLSASSWWMGSTVETTVTGTYWESLWKTEMAVHTSKTSQCLLFHEKKPALALHVPTLPIALDSENHKLLRRIFQSSQKATQCSSRHQSKTPKSDAQFSSGIAKSSLTLSPYLPL